MKQCFHEDPYQRPCFEKLKTSMTQICSILDKKSLPLAKNNSGKANDGVLYTDIKMKERYFNMKAKNKHLKNLNHFCPNAVRYVKPFAASITHISKDSFVDSTSIYNINSDFYFGNHSSLSEAELDKLDFIPHLRPEFKISLERKQKRIQNKNKNPYEAYPGQHKTKH